MTQPITDFRNELKLLKARVEAAERELVQLRRRQLPLSEPPQPVRLVKTRSDTTYPSANGGTFEYVHEELTFNPSQGSATQTFKSRSATSQGVGQSVHSGEYIANGGRCLAIEQPNGKMLLLPWPRTKMIGRVASSGSVAGRETGSSPAQKVVTTTIHVYGVEDHDSNGTFELRTHTPPIHTVTAYVVGGLPLLANMWVEVWQEARGGKLCCSPLPGQVANRGINLRWQGNPIPNPGTLELAVCEGYENDTNLPIYFKTSTNEIIFKATHAHEVAGMRYRFYGRVSHTGLGGGTNPLVWITDSCVFSAGPIGVAGTHVQGVAWVEFTPTQLVIPANGPLTDSGGDTLTVPSATIAFPAHSLGYGTFFGGGYVPATTSDQPLTIDTVYGTASGGTFEIEEFLFEAELFGIGDGYNH